MTTPLDHYAHGKARLIQAFKDKPKALAFLEVNATSWQALENAFIDLLDLRFLSTATGISLDRIGKLVGQKRLELSDDDYRRFLRARIATNRSNGTILDVIKVAKLVLNNADLRVVVDNQGIATYVVRIADGAVTDALADIVISFLREATAAGVRVLLETSRNAPADTFNFFNGPGKGFRTSARRQLNDPGLTVNVDTMVRARQAVATSIQFVADGAGAGTLTDGAAAVFHFQSGVTTVGNFEASLATSEYLSVYLAGTPAAVLVSPDDVKTIALTGAVTGGKFANVRE